MMAAICLAASSIVDFFLRSVMGFGPAQEMPARSIFKLVG